jgi:PD-(D/E)XK nuclease superfamily protein
LLEGESADGRPKKADIDKMHAYRDAIRGEYAIRVVRYAAILYPGPKERYAEGLEALRAYPGLEHDLDKRIGEVLRRALHPTSEAETAASDTA